MDRGEAEQKEQFGSDRETGIFPTFFFAGFECSTFVWKDRQRKDFVTLTGHDRHLDQDYERVEATADSGAGRLAQLVARLPADERFAVHARIVEERSYREIAAELSCSELVIRKRVSRGLARVREQLGDE